MVGLCLRGRSVSRLCAFLLSLFVSALIPVAAVAQLPAAADTFVSPSTPNLNYGEATTLVVLGKGAAYLRFDLSAVPANAQVKKATLLLFVDAYGTAGTFDVYPVLGS